MKKISMIFCFAMFLFALLFINDTRLKEVLSDLENYAQKGLEEWQIPGMAVGIVWGATHATGWLKNWKELLAYPASKGDE